LWLYLRKSDFSWSEMVSIYPPEAPQKVYTLEEYATMKYW
jgi:hypothetical protein